MQSRLENSSLKALAAKLPELRKLLHCPSLELDVRREWGPTPNAQNQVAHRLEIRKAISSLFHEDLLDLSQPPLSTKRSFSISHCPEAGGFASRTIDKQIGFDLELEERVQPKVVARVSSAEEVALAPSPGLHWVAKEAAYKSLRLSGQPKLLSMVHIDDWVLNEGDLPLWGYRASIPGENRALSGYGVAFCSSPFLFAIFT